jgi:hypothetical protein
MRRLTRKSIAVSVTAGALAVAVAAAVALAPQASADDTPTPEPDAVTSMNAELIYGAVGRVPPLTPPGDLEFSGFQGFGLADMFDPNFGMGAGLPPDAAGELVTNALLGLGFANFRLHEAFPDASVEMGTPDDPLFANWKAENGSATVESPGGHGSTTSPAEGVNYDLNLTENGTVLADFSAKATIAGTSTDISGAYSFQTNTNGGTATAGHMAVETYLELFDPGSGLRLSGSAYVAGYKTFNVSLGASSFTFGMTGSSKNGPKVSVSTAVGADGRVLGFSLGGETTIPGVPVPVQIRVDLAPGSVSVGSSPAPGVTLSGNHNGAGTTVRLDVDMATFGSWFRRIASGK